MHASYKSNDRDDVTTAVLLPTASELQRYLLHTIQHSCHVEYFLDRVPFLLGVTVRDTQRPHDLAGLGHKFSWPVIRSLPLQYRNRDPAFTEAYIIPGLHAHRVQYHHQMWNSRNGKATFADHIVGAIDTVCSLLEERPYQRGRHSYDEIVVIADGMVEYKRDAVLAVVPEMRSHEIAVEERIRSILDFPNIGLAEECFSQIKARVDGALRMLGEKGHDLNRILNTFPRAA